MEGVLTLGNDKKDYEMDGSPVESTEFDPLGGFAKNQGDFFDIFGKTVGNGDSVSNSGAPLILAIFQSFENGFPAIRGESIPGHEVVHQFHDSRPAFPGVHFGNHSIRRKQTG